MGAFGLKLNPYLYLFRYRFMADGEVEELNHLFWFLVVARHRSFYAWLEILFIQLRKIAA